MHKAIDFVRNLPPFLFFDYEINTEAIPSFIFHKVLPEEFEGLVYHLKINNYVTLGIGEYYDFLVGKKSNKDKKVIITFDDGLRNNWSVAFPILKKYGMKAVFYVNPGLVSSNRGLGSNLDDVWAKNIAYQDLLKHEEKEPIINWDEANKMQSSGLIDIESHAWQHQICFIAENIIDFQHPGSNGRPHYHWLHTSFDQIDPEENLGAPVYPYLPRLVARRFFDDAGLRNACINHVIDNGGKDFFRNKNWRISLSRVVAGYRRTHKLTTYLEDEIEQEICIRDSLLNSKFEIEKKMGKRCEHFAYPWNISGELSLFWLKELGFKTVFRFMNSWRMSREGMSPYDLSRTEGYWIESLPGKGKVSIFNKARTRIASTISKRFIQPL